MKTAFFVCDAHLGFHEPDQEKNKLQSFLDFLEHVGKEGSVLFILGDLFDFWFEYKMAIPRHYFSVMCAFQELRKRGVTIHYAVGNHDFGLKDFMGDELGIHIHKRPATIELDGKKIFIAHGDGLLPRDTGGRFMKLLMRNPVSLAVFRCLHPDIGFALAKFFSKLSRNSKEIKDRDDEYRQCAQHLFSQGVDYVVLGHTHRPFQYTEAGKTYVNAGDWMENVSYAKLEKNTLTLEYWTH